MDLINTIVTKANDVLYGYVLLIVFAAAAIFFTVMLKGVQFRYAIHAAKLLISKHSGGGMSGFASYCVSTASRVGTGNMAGVMGAISVGGPGAIFWMWAMALFGGSLAFVESTLAQLYKKKDANGDYIGGASFYIKSALKQPLLALIFAVLMILAYTAFNGIQANTISAALYSFKIPVIATGGVLTLITAIILLSPKRETLTKACSVLVPAMAIPYILVGLIIFLLNIPKVPSVFLKIFSEAFKPTAFFGGAIGLTISVGLKRGLFSNEAGMGGAPHAAAAATTNHPVRQGLIQMFSVFTDTLIICSTSAFILLLSPEAMDKIGEIQGIQLLQLAMQSHIGSIGTFFITICVLLFAYTSVLGNFFYIKVGATALKDNRAMYFVVVAMTLGLIMAGSIASFDTIWNLGDFFMSIMALVNIVVLFVLYKPAILLLSHYSYSLKQGKDPVYKKSDIKELNSDAIEVWDDR